MFAKTLSDLAEALMPLAFVVAVESTVDQQLTITPVSLVALQIPAAIFVLLTLPVVPRFMIVP